MLTATGLAARATAGVRTDAVATTDAEVLPGLAWADTLVVVASPLSTLRTPATAAVVTRIELAAEPVNRDLADLLAATAGFQMRRLGADGSSAIPSLRGGSAAQIRVFLDGMPLPDARDGGSALDLVPAERLTAVEIHRGGVPAALGGAGGIGAVNLLTSAVPARPYFEAGAGSFGARSLRGGAGWIAADGRSAVDVVAHTKRAENDFAYLDHLWTFHNTADDTVQRRGNAWLHEWGGWLGASHLGPRLSLRAGAGWLRRDGGRPGPLGNLSPHANVRLQHGDLRARADLDDGRLTLDLAAGRGDERLHDPNGEVLLGRNGVARSLSHDAGARAGWVPGRGRAVAPSLQVSWRRQWQEDSFENAADPQGRRTQYGVVAAVEAVAGRLRVTPAWRWQRTIDDMSPVPSHPSRPPLPPVVHQRDDRSPSLGMVWETLPGHLFVEAHAAYAVREPSWVELFGVRGGIDGNRALKPEAITSYDAALTWRPGAGRLNTRLAAFDAATDDKIIFLQNSQHTSKARNIGSTRTRGLEAEASLHGFGPWRLSGNLTWQDARDRSGLPAWDGKRLPFLPPVEARLYATMATGPWEPWAELTHQSGNSRDRADTELGRAPARTRLNLGLVWRGRAPWIGGGAKLHATAACENLTDNAVYDVEGFPLPGRTWRLSVALRDL